MTACPVNLDAPGSFDSEAAGPVTPGRGRHTATDEDVRQDLLALLIVDGVFGVSVDLDLDLRAVFDVQDMKGISADGDHATYGYAK
jgi:hypothetical protein